MASFLDVLLIGGKKALAESKEELSKIKLPLPKIQPKFPAAMAKFKPILKVGEKVGTRVYETWQERQARERQKSFVDTVAAPPDGPQGLLIPRPGGIPDVYLYAAAGGLLILFLAIRK